MLQLVPDLTIWRIVNGMWQVAGFEPASEVFVPAPCSMTRTVPGKNRRHQLLCTLPLATISICTFLMRRAPHNVIMLTPSSTQNSGIMEDDRTCLSSGTNCSNDG